MRLQSIRADDLAGRNAVHDQGIGDQRAMVAPRQRLGTRQRDSIPLHELDQAHQVRGEIVSDRGTLDKIERTSFQGPHFVECYIVKDGYCVARDRIDVPIGDH